MQSHTKSYKQPHPPLSLSALPVAEPVAAVAEPLPLAPHLVVLALRGEDPLLGGAAATCYRPS